MSSDDQVTINALLRQSTGERLDLNCPGCGMPLTFSNVGGYRDFCERCVQNVGPMPGGMGSGHVVGGYPNLRWERSE